MNRFFSVFLVATFSSTLAFAASTNYTGNGTEVIDFTSLQFSGEEGENAATIAT